MVRGVLYVRVSTGKQEADNQLKDLRAYALRCNIDVVGEYVDVISGKELSRPDFDRLFVDAHKRLFDIVLFWDLSRFSRAGTLHTLNKLHELELEGIGWDSYQEPYFRTSGAFKDVLLSLLATIAKIEREKISERTKAGLRNKKSDGVRGKDKKPRKVDGYKARFRKGRVNSPLKND